MKKIIALVTFLFIAFTAAHAQEGEEQAAYGIRYKFIYKYDLDKPDKPYIEDRMVVVTENSFADKGFNDRGYEKMMNAQTKSPGFKGDYNFRADSTMSYTNTPKSLIYYPKVKKLYEVEKIIYQRFVFEREYPVIDWTLKEDTMRIGGYLCKKAICSFKGRAYSAWYTNELKYTGGPWKLNGLPGVILSAADSKGEVMFTFFQLLTYQDKKEYISLPVNPSKLPMDKYIKIKRIIMDAGLSYVNQAGILDSKRPEASQDEKNNLRAGHPYEGVDKLTITNPIEL